MMMMMVMSTHGTVASQDEANSFSLLHFSLPLASNNISIPPYRQGGTRTALNMMTSKVEQ